MATVDPSKYLSDIATQNNSQPQSNSVNAADVFLNTVRNSQQRASGSPSNYLSNNVVSPENYLNSSALSNPLQSNLRATPDKWRTTVGGADAYLRNTGNDDFVYDDNVNRTQYNSMKSLLDDVLADQTLLRQQGRTIDADNLQYDIDRLQQKLDSVDEIYKAYHTETTAEPQGEEPQGLGFWGTLKNIFTGGSKGSIGNVVEGQRNLYALGQGARDAETNKEIERWTLEVERAQKAIEEDTAYYGADSGVVEGDRNILEYAQMMLDAYSQVPAAQRGAAEESAKLSDEIALSAQEDIEKAKEGKGKAGQILVDVGTNAVQMAEDVLLGKLLGTGNGMLPMAGRSYGAAVQEARQAGASEQEQALYGFTKAGIEMVTEKIADGLAGAYGKGTADEVIEAVIGKLASNNAARNALRLGFSALGEGSEELASDLLDPIAKAIYDKGETLKTKYTDPEAWKEAVAEEAYDMLIGAIMGFGGGTLDLATGGYTQKNAELNTPNQTAQETAPQNTEAQTAPVEEKTPQTILAEKATSAQEQAPQVQLTEAEQEAMKYGSPTQFIKQGRQYINDNIGNDASAYAQARQIWRDAQDKASGEYQRRVEQQEADARAAERQALEDERNSYQLNELEQESLKYNSPGEFKKALDQMREAPFDTVASLLSNSPYSEATSAFNSAREKQRNIADVEARIAAFDAEPTETTGTAPQNSPTEQTSAAETDNVSTEPTPSVTEVQQAASAPTVSEVQQNPYQERADAIRQKIDEAQAQNTETQQQKTEPKARAERTPRQKPARRTPEARNIFNATDEEIKAKGFEPSQADNSMSGIAQMQGAEDHTQTMAKERISEEESVQRATARVRADAKGETERLLNKNAWTGVDIDAAAQIGAQLADEARQSGDWSAYDNFYQQCEQRHSEAGRALQVLSKYVRDKGRQIAQKAADTIAKSKLSDARKKEVRAKIEDYAARYDEIRNDRVDYQRKNASNPQSDLKTTDDGSIVDGTQFEQTADNQRTSISDEDVQSLRDMIMEIAKERNTTYLGDKALNAANKILGKTEAVFNKILEKRLNKLGDTEADVDYMMRLLENQISRIATDNVNDIGGKIKSWQVRSMLLTLTSFERNMGGNESYGIFDVLAENFVGRATDDLLSKVTGKKTTVKQSRWLNEAYRKGALEAAERSMLEIALDADPSEGKYTGTGSALKHNSKNPVERFLANLDQILAYSLNSTDKLQRGGIESELSTGLTQIKNSNLTEAEIEEMAQRAADERLFQEDNTVTKTAQWVHDWLNSILGAGGTLYDANGQETQSRSEAVRRRGGFGIGDAVSAFVKVPINIGMKAYQWSPLAYGESIKRIVDVIADARNGTLTAEQQRKAVMTTARSVTGTGLIYLAQLAAKAGLLKSFDDEDDWDKQSLESAEGKSGLQFNVSAMQRLLNGEDPAWDEKNDLVLSLGWLEPANAWMRMGYALSQLDEDSNVVDKAFALGQGAVQSYLDMPLVSSLSDAVNTFKYSTSDNIGSKLLEAGEAYVLSTISGFIPNIMKQIAKGTDTKYRSTDADTFKERFVNTVKMGIPGKYGRESLAPKLDNYGREREYKGGSAYGNFANATLRPGTINRIDSEIVTAELDRLYEATGDKKIYPDRKPPKSLSYDGYDPVELNTEEKEIYQKVYGDTVYQMHQDLINSDEYKTLTDDQKALVLDSINAYAKAAATSAIMDKWDSEYTGGEGEINWFAKYTNDWDDEAEHFKDDTAGLTRYIATEKAFKTDLKEGNFDAIESLIKNIDTHTDSNGNFTNPEMQYYADNIDGFEKYVLAMRAGVTPEMFAQAKDMYSYWNQAEWNSLSQEAKTNRLNGMFDDAYETADWTDKQKDTVKDLLKYYNMSPVNTQRYEKMGNYGVDSRTITAIESDIEALKASAGYEELNDTQKKYRQYEAVLKRAATLSDDQALELVRSYGSLGPGAGAMKYMILQYFGDKPESFQEELYNAYRDENKSSNGKTWGHNWGRTKPDNPFD